jgi:hypothetical protein
MRAATLRAPRKVSFFARSVVATERTQKIVNAIGRDVFLTFSSFFADPFLFVRQRRCLFSFVRAFKHLANPVSFLFPFAWALRPSATSKKKEMK